MDVYVVSNIWQREGSAIVGAAVDDAGAKSIADRVGAYRWGPWSEIGGTQERVAMLADGSEWPKLRQEIVRVPLAGYIADWPQLNPIDETGPALLRGVPALTTRARISQARMRTITNPRE